MGQRGKWVQGVSARRPGADARPATVLLLAIVAAVPLSTRDLPGRAQERFSDGFPAPVQGAVYAARVFLRCGATLDTSAFLHVQF